MSLFRLAFRAPRMARSVRVAVPVQRLAAAHIPASRTGSLVFRAQYSAGSGLSREAIESRVLEVLKGYEKIDPTKLTTSSSLAADLGLDSLDAVEVVMSVEEEFGIEIPDNAADAILTVQDAIDYVASAPDAH